jgi:hypothetical protein
VGNRENRDERIQDQRAALAAEDEDSAIEAMQADAQPMLDATEVDTLVLVNDDNGDTLMLDMQSGEGAFLGGGPIAEIIVEDSDEVMDEDVDLSFGSRELDEDEDGGWVMPDIIGFIEERLLPPRAARHSHNFRHELLLAARSLIDASLRGMAQEEVDDYVPPMEDKNSKLTANLPRRPPSLRRAAPAKRGPQRIELD